MLVRVGKLKGFTASLSSVIRVFKSRVESDMPSQLPAYTELSRFYRTISEVDPALCTLAAPELTGWKNGTTGVVKQYELFGNDYAQETAVKQPIGVLATKPTRFTASDAILRGLSQVGGESVLMKNGTGGTSLVYAYFGWNAGYGYRGPGRYVLTFDVECNQANARIIASMQRDVGFSDVSKTLSLSHGVGRRSVVLDITGKEPVGIAYSNAGFSLPKGGGNDTEGLEVKISNVALSFSPSEGAIVPAGISLSPQLIFDGVDDELKNSPITAPFTGYAPVGSVGNSFTISSAPAIRVGFASVHDAAKQAEVIEVLNSFFGESFERLIYTEEQYAYGIAFDTTLSTPICTRILNVDLHRSLPIQSRMRGCLLNDNGEVVEYLSATDWRGSVRDGSRGQVMVEIPAHYRKFESDGTTYRAKISEYAISGYHFVPKCYVSAYEATLHRSTNKLCSVANPSGDYRGGNNQSDWDGTYKSLLGRPVTNISRTAFRNAARLRKAGSTEWNCNDYNAYKALFWLYYVEYANRNSQTPFNAAKDANGFAQGGLGNGATTLSLAQWSEYNGNCPFIPCGYTDHLGNASGEVAYTMPNAENNAYATIYANRYRGIENPFGHVWKWLDGINIEIKSETDGGTSKVYVAETPENYNDSNYNGYAIRGLEAREGGYTKEMIMGPFGDIIPAVVGGGSTVYWSDYHYTDIPASGIVLRSVLSGGTASYGAAAGLDCADSWHVPSYAHSTVGSRLCFIPVIDPQLASLSAEDLSEGQDGIAQNLNQ